MKLNNGLGVDMWCIYDNHGHFEISLILEITEYSPNCKIKADGGEKWVYGINLLTFDEARKQILHKICEYTNLSKRIDELEPLNEQ